MIGAPFCDGEVHDLADLVGVGFRQGAAEDREVLREDVDGPAVDRARSADDAVSRELRLLHPEVAAAVDDERVELEERPGIEQTARCARAPSSLPSACWRSTRSGPPPSRAFSRSASRSAIRFSRVMGESYQLSEPRGLRPVAESLSDDAESSARLRRVRQRGLQNDPPLLGELAADAAEELLAVDAARRDLARAPLPSSGAPPRRGSAPSRPPPRARRAPTLRSAPGTRSSKSLRRRARAPCGPR